MLMYLFFCQYLETKCRRNKWEGKKIGKENWTKPLQTFGWLSRRSHTHTLSLSWYFEIPTQVIVNVDEEEIIAIMAMYAVNHISNPTCMVIDTFVDSIHQHAIVTLYLRIFFPNEISTFHLQGLLLVLHAGCKGDQSAPTPKSAVKSFLMVRFSNLSWFSMTRPCSLARCNRQMKQ